MTQPDGQPYTTPLRGDPGTWANMPQEMRDLPQWLLAMPNAKGLFKIPGSLDGFGKPYAASSVDRRQWLTYDQAVAAAVHFGFGIGFVLTATDPFCCVDLDVKDPENEPDRPHKWTTEEHRQRFGAIAMALNSFTESSCSGKGAHIWVRANIGEGCQRDNVDIFSQERFIATTGRMLIPMPIVDRMDVVANMVWQMRGAQNAAEMAHLMDEDASEPDDELWRRAGAADNATKFRDLCEGNWQKYHYPSQSEADLSLMSMFTFYSKSNEQCRRMFRLTGLGMREKAIKDDRYLNLTIRICRQRQARQALAQEEFNRQAAAVVSASRHAATTVAPVPPAQGMALYGAGGPPQPPARPPGPPPVAVAADADVGGTPWPPGFVGALARAIYDGSFRPVREVSIVAALGWMAGIAGKAWNIPGSGLNLYCVLVARSGVGKEAMHTGISTWSQQLSRITPNAFRFVSFADYPSGVSLAKDCAVNPSFVNVSGEWGRKLQRLAKEDGKDGPLHQLRTVMTNLYQKSGATSVLGGVKYSDKEKNVESIAGVAYSMIGETTPGTFYECLTESMMEDGFLSRFTVVAYEGTRPRLVNDPVLTFDPGLVQYGAQLVEKAQNTILAMQHIRVKRDAAAAALLDDFNIECDDTINATLEESRRQMWSRAHLKVYRIAALLAVGDDYSNPLVQAHHVEWALSVVRRDIAMMQERMDSGDVGAGDSSRDKKALLVLKQYFTEGPAASHKIPDAMWQKGYVPRSYLINRLQHVASFSRHPYGSTSAVDACVKSLVDSGWLMEVDKSKLTQDFGYRGRCFQLMQVLD